MTTPTPELGAEDLAAEPAVTPRLPDPELAEDYAESVGIDPTPEQIDRYLQLEGDEPLGELRDLDDDVVIGESGRADV